MKQPNPKKRGGKRPWRRNPSLETMIKDINDTLQFHQLRYFPSTDWEESYKKDYADLRIVKKYLEEVVENNKGFKK